MTQGSFNAPEPLLKAQKLAQLMDGAIRLPIVGIRVGLDFLIGLIPGLGDLITMTVAFSIVRYARKMGMPKPLVTRMVRNIIVDFLLGLIPVVGDLVDLFFKANKANVRIMERWWLNEHQQDIRQNTQEKLQQWSE